MRDFVLTLLSLSASGTLVALVILSIKPLIRHRITHAWQYYIFLLVLLRLLVPVSPEWSIVGNWFAGAGLETSSIIQPIEPAAQSQAEADFVMPSQTGPQKTIAADTVPAAISPQPQTAIWSYAWLIWLLGFIGALAMRGYGYLTFSRRLQETGAYVADPHMQAIFDDCRRQLRVNKEVTLVQSLLAPTPMLIGLLNPIIALPQRAYTADELRYIFMHELTHCKRSDLGYKWLTQLVLCIHWFNPLLYYAAKEIDRACELSCDEAVIRGMNAQQKQGYGNTLIAMAAASSSKRSSLLGAMSQEKRHLKERLTAIMRSSRKSRAAASISITLAIAIALVAVLAGAFTTPSGQAKEDPITVAERAVIYGDYHLTDIASYRTPYVGNHSKVSHMTGQLPTPDPYYTHRYIALQTTNQPYGLTVYYEPATNNAGLVKPDHQSDGSFANVLDRNALVLFAMIDNVDEIDFAFRDTPSTGQLDQTAYEIQHTYRRADFADKFDLPALGRDLTKLGQLLLNWKPMPLEQGQEQQPQASPEASQTAASSPDGKYRIFAYGMDSSITQGGQYPAEGIRLLDAHTGQALWSMTPGFYNQSFLWSKDSRYVAVSYTARTYGETLLVDARSASRIDLPNLQTIREQLSGQATTVNDSRSDPYFQAAEWLDGNRLSVQFQWTGTQDEIYKGTYVYDVGAQKLLGVKLIG